MYRIIFIGFRKIKHVSRVSLLKIAFVVSAAEFNKAVDVWKTSKVLVFVAHKKSVKFAKRIFRFTQI